MNKYFHPDNTQLGLQTTHFLQSVKYKMKLQSIEREKSFTKEGVL